MASSSSVLPEKPIQTEPFPETIQDLVLDYVADGIAESKSIYTAKNRSTLFESGTQEKPYDKLVLHVALHNLLRHVVSGEQTQAQAIIESHPEFLFKSGSVTDLSGNTFVSFSPAELARFAHDVEMLEMMKPYADNVEGGVEKFAAILKQATEYEEAKKQDVYDFSDIIAAIIGNNEERITDALNQFRQTFATRAIKNSEKSYNIKNLQKAYEVYAGDADGWSFERCELFWCQVIGFLKRSLPACFAQAFRQSLYAVTEGGKPLERGQNFHPSDLLIPRGLGFDFAKYAKSWPFGSAFEKRVRTILASKLEGPLFGSLCQAKTTALRELMQRPSYPAESDRCSIM